jgi:flagellar biosynthetic protein FliP
VWNDVYHDAVAPYTENSATMPLEDAWEAGVRPIRRFMARQIDRAGNSEDVWLFYEYARPSQGATPPQNYDDVPLEVLAPAFLLSELKIAFLIGFQVYLPLLVVDLLVASISSALGMVMLPPAMVSLPLKVLLFVLADGWRLVVGMLLESFAPYG